MNISEKLSGLSLRLFTLSIILIVFTLAGCTTTQEQKARDKKLEKQIDTNIQLGIEYMSRKKWGYAKERLDIALELDPDSASANNAMGLLMWKLNETDKAVEFLTKATDIDPKDSSAQNNLGVLLCQQGKLDDAVERFQLALKNPMYETPAQANLNAGLCLMKKHDTKNAAKFFRAALKENRNLPKALSAMAKISFEQKKYLTTRAFLQRYFEVGKDTPEILYIAVKVEEKLGGGDAHASYKIRLKGKFPDSKEAKLIR